MATLRKYLIGAGLQFERLVHYPYSREHGGMQSNMVAENSTSESASSRKRDRELLGLAWALKP